MLQSYHFAIITGKRERLVRARNVNGSRTEEEIWNGKQCICTILMHLPTSCLLNMQGKDTKYMVKKLDGTLTG